MRFVSPWWNISEGLTWWRSVVGGSFVTLLAGIPWLVWSRVWMKDSSCWPPHSCALSLTTLITLFTRDFHCKVSVVWEQLVGEISSRPINTSFINVALLFTLKNLQASRLFSYICFFASSLRITICRTGVVVSRFATVFLLVGRSVVNEWDRLRETEDVLTTRPLAMHWVTSLPLGPSLTGCSAVVIERTREMRQTTPREERRGEE